ncbi:MAG: flagellar assembly protein FliH [Burkholderiaceae bacterium]
MKLSSDVAQAAPASRIIPRSSVGQAQRFDISQLAIRPVAPAAAVQKRLGRRDLDNDTARAAYEMGRERGFEMGARAGLEQGYSEGSQALEEFESRKAADVARQMQELADSFRTGMAALESQVASDLVSLAIDIAREVLRRELATAPEALLPVAREALRAVGDGATQMEIHINPADAAMLREHLEQQGNLRGWALHEDESMMRGGLRVEADTGVADASFETRWQNVMAGLGRDEEPLP